MQCRRSERHRCKSVMGGWLATQAARGLLAAVVASHVLQCIAMQSNPSTGPRCPAYLVGEVAEGSRHKRRAQRLGLQARAGVGRAGAISRQFADTYTSHQPAAEGSQQEQR